MCCDRGAKRFNKISYIRTVCLHSHQCLFWWNYSQFAPQTSNGVNNCLTVTTADITDITDSSDSSKSTVWKKLDNFHLYHHDWPEYSAKLVEWQSHKFCSEEAIHPSAWSSSATGVPTNFARFQQPLDSMDTRTLLAQFLAALPSKAKEKQNTQSDNFLSLYFLSL